MNFTILNHEIRTSGDKLLQTSGIAVSTASNGRGLVGVVGICITLNAVLNENGLLIRCGSKSAASNIYIYTHNIGNSLSITNTMTNENSVTILVDEVTTINIYFDGMILIVSTGYCNSSSNASIRTITIFSNFIGRAIIRSFKSTTVHIENASLYKHSSFARRNRSAIFNIYSYITHLANTIRAVTAYINLSTIFDVNNIITGNNLIFYGIAMTNIAIEPDTGACAVNGACKIDYTFPVGTFAYIICTGVPCKFNIIAINTALKTNAKFFDNGYIRFHGQFSGCIFSAININRSINGTILYSQGTTMINKDGLSSNSISTQIKDNIFTINHIGTCKGNNAICIRFRQGVRCQGDDGEHDADHEERQGNA